MKVNNSFKLAMLISVLVAVSIACASSNNEPILVESGNESDVVSGGEPQGPQIFAVGDVVEVKDHIISVIGAEIYDTGQVEIVFIIKNTGDEELLISSLLSFSARDEEGLNLEQEIFDCGAGIDGSIASGDIFQGSICWKAVRFPLKIYYDPSLLGNSIVWEISAAASSEINALFERGELEVFAVSDVVEKQGQRITLTEVNIQNGLMTATFVVENTGTEEIMVSSLLSFTAKGAGGVKLEQELFDCGNSLDGSIIAGDKLKGSICWSNATFPVIIQYDSDLFGSGTIYWEVTE